ncbi:hypothetical protein BKH23_00250 [Actinomyces oris]|nr:hypothetical protein BKH23_00250 [Actinomyces oris]
MLCHTFIECLHSRLQGISKFLALSQRFFMLRMRFVIDCFLHLSQCHSNTITPFHFYGIHRRIDGFTVFARGFIVRLAITQWGCFFAHVIHFYY